MTESNAFQTYDGWEHDLAIAVCLNEEASDDDFDAAVLRLQKGFGE